MVWSVEVFGRREDALGQRGRIRERRLVGAVHGVDQELLDAGADLFLFRVGEIGIVGVAAAIANAVYHATGTRVRDLPITLDKLQRAASRA